MLPKKHLSGSAIEMEVEPTLLAKRRVIRKKHFDEYTQENEHQCQSPEELFRLEFFFCGC